jgi:hypothetical protein
MSSFQAGARTGPGSQSFENVAARNAQGLAIQSYLNSVGKAGEAAKRGQIRSAGMVGLQRPVNLRPVYDDPANVAAKPKKAPKPKKKR